MSWPDGDCYSCPLQSFVVSFLSSHIFTVLFSWTEGILSHQNSLTHRFPRFPLRNLCPPRHAPCVLSSLYCNRHSLLLSSYLSRIGKIGNPSCSTCRHLSQDTSHLILHCLAKDSLHCSLFGDYLSFYNFWSRPWVVAWPLGLHDLLPCPHPSKEVE